MNPKIIPEGRDQKLWQIAQRRVSFKRHLLSYVLVTLFLWLMWLFSPAEEKADGLPWPAWVSLGWGIGIAFHFVNAYLTGMDDPVEREYQKIIKQQAQ